MAVDTQTASALYRTGFPKILASEKSPSDAHRAGFKRANEATLQATLVYSTGGGVASLFFAASLGFAPSVSFGPEEDSGEFLFFARE